MFNFVGNLRFPYDPSLTRRSIKPFTCQLPKGLAPSPGLCDLYNPEIAKGDFSGIKGDLSVKSNSYLITFKDTDPKSPIAPKGGIEGGEGSAFEMLKGVKGVKLVPKKI